MLSPSLFFIGIGLLLSGILHHQGHGVLANNFAGANSYYLWAVSDSDRIAVLDAMKNADMKLLRVFITKVDAGTKGSTSVSVNDLETVAVGSYDDTVLRMIDALAAEAHARDIKLIIAMHDRYSLGCWGTDAYVKKYNLPTTNCQDGVPDSSIFYTNQNAINDFENRLRHILNFQSPNFGVPWRQLSDAIFAFEIQNEAMGHMNQVAPNWWCDRANTIRSVLGSWGIQISTGGGTDLPTSLQSQFFNCADIQIIALHDYNLDSSYIASHVDAAKPLALSSGKRMLYEEFGALGSRKQSEIQAVTNLLISVSPLTSIGLEIEGNKLTVLWKTGIPWMYWEIWTDEPSWNTLQSQAQATRKQGGEFGWPEIDGGQ